VLIGALLFVLWWVFFSRAPWPERLGAVALMAGALIATRQLLHESVATGGMGFLYFVYSIPFLCLAFVLWAVLARRTHGRPRWLSLAAIVLAVTGAWTLIRMDGTRGSGADFAWRWSPTPEERLLATIGSEPVAAASRARVSEAESEWPGFRGPERDGVVPGVRIETDWASSPPAELWRHPVGPGWSSFAVRSDFFYTQEQRGDDEVVSCYRLGTGEPVWIHSEPVRFWEANAGAGPRATPTLSRGRVYALGATGILAALDATDGSLVWSRDTASDTGAKLPVWGFSGSPLVVEDVVAVAASGSLMAYDIETGAPRWVGPAGGEGYSSPQLVTLDGVAQIVQISGDGAVGVSPADGRLLWEHAWAGYPIVQPAKTSDGDLLVSVTAQSGVRRLALAGGPGGWTVEERWTSNGLKPYFNDFVVHEGHAYGFDGNILASIDLQDGRRTWKGGRYGNGQLVLLPDQDLILVLSESGKLALVRATPDRFREIARFEVFDSKTWNHPVLIGDLLLLRNDREMAAFRLALAPG
jgi:outer membrane protein assembly factor BamB